MALGRIYGLERWIKNYGDSDDGTWASALAGMSVDDLHRGIRGCSAGSKWLPTLPEFRDLCLPSPADLGLPDPDDAYVLAASGSLDHPAVHAAATTVGLWAMKTGAERETRPKFIAAYARLLAALRAGAELDAPPKIEPPETAEITPEIAAKARAAREKFRAHGLRSRRGQ